MTTSIAEHTRSSRWRSVLKLVRGRILCLALLAVLPPWAAAAGPPPVAAQMQQMAPPLTTWDALWDASWRRAAFYYRIEAASTTQPDPTCRGNLGLDVLVKNTILAVSFRKYGDAARFMAEFQDRSQCLTREGARGLEFALAMYVHRAVNYLPRPQAQIAVQGVMNLGMQTFDQLQYTGQSWWLPMVNIDNARIQSLMASYPRRDLGLWIYDFDRGMMVQSGFQDGLDRLIWSMQRIDNFGLGGCNLLNMSGTGFVCPDKGSPGGGGKGGGSGMQMPPGGIPSNGVSCVLASVNASGARGQFACMSRAIAGMLFDPRAAGADLAKQASKQPGIRDKFCSMSAEGDTTTTTTTATTETKGPGAWDKVKDAAGKVKDIAVSILSAVFDKTPPVIDTLGQGLSTEGSDAARGGLQAHQEFTARNNGALLTDEPQGYYDARAGRVTTEPEANKRTITGDGTEAGGGCGAGSNAAARAKTLYACTMGADMTPRTPNDGRSVVRTPAAGGSPRPNPTVALFDPSQAAGPISGAMSCQMQGGDLARASLNDQRCATMRCVQGEVCACNAPGGMAGGQPMERKQPLKAGPECTDGPCAPSPVQGGTIGTTGGTAGPLPATIGPAVPPLGNGPAPGPATAPIPKRPQ